MMYTSSEGIQLKVKVENLNFIRSYQLRHSLHNTISSLERLLNETRHFTPNEYTQSALDRYLDHLTKSCESPKKITERATWLVRYGEVVISRLDDLNNQYRHSGGEETGEVFAILMNEIADLFVAIRDLHVQSLTLNPDLEGGVLTELDRLFGSASQMAHVKNMKAFIDVISSVHSIRDYVQKLSGTKSLMSNPVLEMDLAHHLKKLVKQIDYFHTPNPSKLN